jgi:hypothetical protein
MKLLKNLLNLSVALFILNAAPVLSQITNRSAAWLKGYADGKICVKLNPCVFKNPYKVISPIPRIRNQQANDNADYIGGWIAGKSAGNV